MRKSITQMIVALWVAFPAVTMAADVSVSLSGTALKGGPSFDILFNDRVVGSGVVDPIPPAGRGTDFTFSVPDAQLKSGGDLKIRLTNDYFEKGKGDRNLTIMSAHVGDINVVADDFKVYRHDQLLPRSDGILSMNSDVAVASPPATGWLGSAQAAQTCQLGDVTISGFGNSSSQLTDDQRAQLSQISLSKNCNLVVTGYGSAVGNEGANLALSRQRAQAVVSALIQAGFSADAIKIVGLGGTDQFGTSQADNRRVVISQK